MDNLKLYVEKNEPDNGRFMQVIQSIDSILLVGNPSEKDVIEATTRIADIYRKQGQLTEAVDFYNTIILVYEHIKKPTIDETRTLVRLYIPFGASHEELGMWNRAMDYYMKALSMAEEYGFEDMQAMIYNNIGAVHFTRTETGNLDRAEFYFNKALEINKRLENKFELFINYNNLAEVYMNKEDYIRAIDYALIGIQQITNESDPFYYYFMQSSIGYIYYLMGDYKMALSYLQNAATHQRELEFVSDLTQTYTYLYRTYEGMGMPDSAQYYLDRALYQARSIENSYIESKVLRNQAEFFYKQNRHKDAYLSLLDATSLGDSISRVDNQQRIEFLESILNADANYLENRPLTERIIEQFREKPVAMLGFVLGIVLAVAAFIALYRSKRSGKLLQSKVEIQKQYAETLEKERVLLEQKRAELQQEVDKQNRELTSSTLSNLRANELFHDVNHELKKLLLEVSSSKTRLYRDHVKDIMAMLSSYHSANNWEEFSYYFEKVHPSFYKKLAELCPTLTPKEMKLCSLLQLGLSSKEISAITFKEVRSVESSRNRLRKKLGIAPEVDIVDFLREKINNS